METRKQGKEEEEGDGYGNQYKEMEGALKCILITLQTVSVDHRNVFNQISNNCLLEIVVSLLYKHFKRGFNVLMCRSCMDV